MLIFATYSTVHQKRDLKEASETTSLTQRHPSPDTLNITCRQHAWKITDSAVLLLKELKSQSIALAALQAVMSEELCV